MKTKVKYIANKEKDNIDYEILSSKVDNINFYDRYNTLYNYLNYVYCRRNFNKK